MFVDCLYAMDHVGLRLCMPLRMAYYSDNCTDSERRLNWLQSQLPDQLLNSPHREGAFVSSVRRDFCLTS
jgi:hypothetical protein